MIYYCGNNLVQEEDNNANRTEEMAHMLWDITMHHVKASTFVKVKWDMSFCIWNCLTWRAFSRNQWRWRCVFITWISRNVYGWFKSPCDLGWFERVEIARKELWRTKQGWRASRLGRHRTKAMVKKRLFSLSFAQIELWGVKCWGGSNHYWIIW